MWVLGVRGPSDAGKTTLVERLVDRLDGRVATVKHLDHGPDIDTEGKDTARHRAAGAVATYGLADSGWFATGAERSLSGLLDDLAVDFDYALVEGYGEARLPHVALGGRSGAGETLLAAPEADAVDVEAVIEALHDTEPRETLDSLVRRATASPEADRAGAVATFTGRVRAKDSEADPRTERLEFEKYDGVAERKLAELRAELLERDGVYEVLLHHRTGVVEDGEDIVFVVVLAGHREEAFDTVEDGIDRLKAEVPLFKKEVTVEDEFWRHER
jgi:molybdopterin synthase catalytic subunit